MEHVDIDDVEQATLSGPTDRRALDEALGTTDVAVKYYELEPGQTFSGGYHTHHDQEEIFYVIEGEATWDTEDGDAAVTVSAGEALRFGPGEFQHGYNDSDGTVRALALGAPPGMDETVSVFACPACGEEAKHDVDLDAENGVSVTTCRACGNVIETGLGD
jgi:uncharacterized cupin superfamily protein